jgi:hypothetical protein
MFSMGLSSVSRVSRPGALLAGLVAAFSTVPLALGAGGANAPIVAGYRFISFDVPGAFDTIAHHINNGGVVAGLWHDSNGGGHGFVRAKDGTITTFDAALSVYTDPEGINGNGDVVGWYYDANFVQHGFLRDRGGTIQSIARCWQSSRSERTRRPHRQHVG